MEQVEQDELEKSVEYDGHKSVFRFMDEAAGLRGYVAIHNDTIGSAVGGTRVFPYATEQDALDDALRLSRAMTYKCALAGTPHGGGKGVIIADPNREKSPALLAAYARVIDALQGQFFTGEDVGLSEADVQFMLTVSPFFIGKAGQAGDPSPDAALSTFYAMQTAAEAVYGSTDLKGRSVAVKGVGKVGGELVRLLDKAGAKIMAADVHLQAIGSIREHFPRVTIVSPATIHAEAVDIYSPCALGGEFSPETMTGVKAKIICGAANNQLTAPTVGDWFFGRGIMYVPDYVANAGGLIDVADELEAGGYNRRRVMNKVRAVKTTVRHILELSDREKKPTNRIADMLAEDIFNHTTKLLSPVELSRL